MTADKLIKISKEAKDKLDDMKEHPRETYGDVIDRLLKERSKWLQEHT